MRATTQPVRWYHSTVPAPGLSNGFARPAKHGDPGSVAGPRGVRPWTDDLSQQTGPIAPPRRAEVGIDKAWGGAYNGMLPR